MDKKVIAFSLWGSTPKYTVGALRNAELAEHLYPGWVCRFYVGASTAQANLERLTLRENVEIVRFDDPGNWRASVWRFFAAADEDVEVMISRDTDSRPTERERDAVNEWLASKKNFHIMRDHPFHAQWPILAGMWGVRGGLLRNIKALLEKHFFDRFKTYDWGVDQVFLARNVHPLVATHALVHDDISPELPWDVVSERRRFPTVRRDYEFVGQVFDEQDHTMESDVDALRMHLQKCG